MAKNKLSEKETVLLKAVDEAYTGNRLCKVPFVNPFSNEASAIGVFQSLVRKGFAGSENDRTPDWKVWITEDGMKALDDLSEKTYTEKQEKTILSFFHVMNYESLESNLHDNCTPVDAKDVADWLETSTAVADGVLVSLLNEGVIVNDQDGNGNPLYLVTEFGIREAFRLRRVTTAIPEADPLAAFVEPDAGPTVEEEPLSTNPDDYTELAPEFAEIEAEVKAEEPTEIAHVQLTASGPTMVIEPHRSRQLKSVLAKNATGHRINVPVPRADHPNRPDWVPVTVMSVEAHPTDPDLRILHLDNGALHQTHRLQRFWFPR